MGMQCKLGGQDSLSCFTTARITFTCILYPQGIYIIYIYIHIISQTNHCCNFLILQALKHFDPEPFIKTSTMGKDQSMARMSRSSWLKQRKWNKVFLLFRKKFHQVEYFTQEKWFFSTNGTLSWPHNPILSSVPQLIELLHDYIRVIYPQVAQAMGNIIERNVWENLNCPKMY